MESTSNAAARSTSRSLDGVPAASSDSIMMWGAKGSGKSIYIASLVYWSPPADAARRVCVLPATSAAAEWVADRVRSLGLGTGDSAAKLPALRRRPREEKGPGRVPHPQSLVPNTRHL